MSTVPRRIVTGHDASGRSVVLSDAPTPKTLDIGTAVFHELWATTAAPTPIDAAEPEPTTRPLRTGPDPPPAPPAPGPPAPPAAPGPRPRRRGRPLHRDVPRRCRPDAPDGVRRH